MPTGRPFKRRVHIRDVVVPAKSIGAHLSAKLELFYSDERTLTDELCDMLCIWLGIPLGPPNPTSGYGTFTIGLEKTTPPEEVKCGADLELLISSPLGSKRCLLQAKVLDPLTLKLRCDSKQGWSKLRIQLVEARKEVGELAFLLIYVPGGLLNGTHYGFDTYEQGFLPPQPGRLEASFGVTLVSVDRLLGPSGRWRNQKEKVVQTKVGEFKHGIPLWEFLLDIFLCRRGSWTAPPEVRLREPRHLLSIAASEISSQEWHQLQDSGEQFK